MIKWDCFWSKVVSPLHYPLICSLVYHRYMMIKFQLEIFPALVVPLSGKPEPVGLDLWRANNTELWCCCELIQGWWYIFMHQGIGSPLVQPMACCLMAPCYYLQISIDLIKHQSLKCVIFSKLHSNLPWTTELTYCGLMVLYANQDPHHH